ncbi:MAG: NUDIX domain-containing protein [Desulfobacterales bacterium]
MGEIVKVTAAILEKDGRILIAQRNLIDDLSGKWEFPGGKIEAGETPEECLARELNEEFDIDVSVGQHLGSNFFHYERFSIDLMAYRAFWKGGRINSTAHKDYKWVTIEELERYDFAPADRKFVERLRSGEIDLWQGTESGCRFCPGNIKNRIVQGWDTVIAFEDNFPVSKGHLLVVPKRHTPDWFLMTERERREADDLIRFLGNRLMESDKTITGFNVGTNAGASAGQTIFHAHIHLIPRRDGDTSNPTGGVRGVIPDKMCYCLDD